MYKFEAATKNMQKPIMYPNLSIEEDRDNIPAPAAVLTKVKIASLIEPFPIGPKVLCTKDLLWCSEWELSIKLTSLSFVIP